MKSNLKLLLTNLIICVSLLISCNSQKGESELASFNIQVIKTEKEIQLKCNDGCAWTELSFSKNNYQPQFVNESGMSEANGKQSKKMDGKLAGFLFSISKTDEGVQLVGAQGIAWKNLNFTLRNYEPRIITQMGMTE